MELLLPSPPLPSSLPLSVSPSWEESVTPGFKDKTEQRHLRARISSNHVNGKKFEYQM
jgi:hypothetical protein